MVFWKRASVSWIPPTGLLKDVPLSPRAGSSTVNRSGCSDGGGQHAVCRTSGTTKYLAKAEVLVQLTHWSKRKLNMIFPGIDPSCNRCGLSLESLGHMFWNCPRISNYWSDIFPTLSRILHRPVDLDPLMAILGIIDSNIIKKKQLGI